MSNLEDCPVLSRWLDDYTWSEENSELVVTADVVENQLLRMQADIDRLQAVVTKCEEITFNSYTTDYDKYIQVNHVLRKNHELK